MAVERIYDDKYHNDVKIIPELDKLYVLESAPFTLKCVYAFPPSEGDGEPVAFYKESKMTAASNTLGFNVTEKRKVAGPATTVTMSIMKDNTVQTDTGVYECKEVGGVTTHTVITVEILSGLKIIPELDKLYVLESAPLKLDCVYVFPSSEGDGEPVAFYKDNEMIAAYNTLGFNVSEKRKIAGPTTTVTMSMMKDKNVQTDRGVYECKLGVTTTYIDITVEIVSVVGMNATLLKDSKTATLGCTVNGVGSGVDQQMTWKHNNRFLTNGDKYLIDATTGTLEIKNPVREDMGAYYCQLTFDPTSARNSQQITPWPVVLLSSPMIDKHENTKNTVQGDKLELKCKVSGYPAPDVKWLKDGSPVIETNRINFLEYEGNANGTIQITGLKFEDEAVYTCFASNEVSPFNATANIQVTVRAATLQRDTILVSVFATLIVCRLVLAIVGFICYRKRKRSSNDRMVVQDEHTTPQRQNTAQLETLNLTEMTSL